MPEKRNRINGFNAVALISIAITFDMLQVFVSFIPIAGGFIAAALSGMAFFVFWVWKKVLRIKSFDSPTRAVTQVVTVVTELIPFLDVLPMLTLGMVITVLTIQHEDKKYNEEQLKKYTNRSANPIRRYPNGVERTPT